MVGCVRPFFRTQAERSTNDRTAAATSGKKRDRWRDIYATLIANGHPPNQIGFYTERQLILYYDAALRHERKQRKAMLIDTNYAVSGGKEALNHLKSLSKEIGM